MSTWQSNLVNGCGVHQREFDGQITITVEFNPNAKVSRSDDYILSPKSDDHFVGMVIDTATHIIKLGSCARYWASKGLLQAIRDNNANVGW